MKEASNECTVISSNGTQVIPDCDYLFDKVVNLQFVHLELEFTNTFSI